MTREIHIDTQELLEQCRQGDRTAQKTLYTRYSRAMYNTAWRIVKDGQEAEDVLQEAFISAFQYLDTFQGTSTFGAWLKRIVVNKALNQVQKRKLEIAEYDGTDVEDISESDSGPDDWEVALVRQAIEDLPDGYRLILSLYLLEGYDHVEIAEILNISVGTSKSQYNRAKKKLREMLKTTYYER